MRFFYKTLLIRFLLIISIPNVGLLTALAQDKNPLTVTAKWVEQRVNPVGIDVKQPRFTWRLTSNQNDVQQSAYQIQVLKSNANFDGASLDFSWDSGWINSNQSHLITYNGKTLQPNLPYYWRVRVKNQGGTISAWSKPANWVTGLVDTELKADWIGFDKPHPAAPNGTNWFNIEQADWIVHPNLKKGKNSVTNYRSKFNVPANFSRLMVGMEANFTARCFINGIEVLQGGRFDAFPSYLDITPYVKVGENTIAFNVDECDHKDHSGLIASVRMEDKAGKITHFYSNANWQTTDRKVDLWNDPKNLDANWVAVKVLGKPNETNTSGQGKEKLQLPKFGSKIFSPPAVYLRKEVQLKKTIRFAVFHGTAQGLYDLYLNGQRVTETGFQPGWTQFEKRTSYVSNEVTKALKTGKNAIGVVLADGWFRGNLLWFGRESFGDKLRFSGQLEIEYTDGTRETIQTDNTWKASYGPIVQSDILNGEIYDARLEQSGWNKPDFNAKSWENVIAENRKDVSFVQRQHLTEPVSIEQELKIQTVTQPKPGVYVVDFGQNFAGWVRLKVLGKKGQAIDLRFAEDINKNGTVYTDNLRGANPADRYICKGGLEVWEPRFTYHGFRYVQITGLTAMPTKEILVGIVAHSAGPITSTFASSSLMLDRIYQNVLWSQRSNYFETMTDCPQRDERYGWVGDAHFFMGSSAYNQNGASFFTKWFQDCVDTQNDKTGNISNGAPGYKPGAGNSQLDWSAAMMITPNAIWERYGDSQPIFQHYDALRKYMTQWEKVVDQVNDFEAKDKKGVPAYKIIGDWVALEKGTSREFIARVIGYIISKQMADFAKLTNHTKDIETFTKLAARYKSDLIEKHIKADGLVDANTQCAYAYVARYGLYNPDQKEAIKAQFKKRMITDNYAVLTGFHGTGNLLPGLTAMGLIDEASKVITSEKSPGWGGMVKRGATTIWERWDGKDDNGEYFNPFMNSFNHYTFGGCGEWMMGNLVGLQTQDAGFKIIKVEPSIISDLNWASGSFESPYGIISNKWERKDGIITMNLNIPANSSANVVLPLSAKNVMLNGKPYSANLQNVLSSGLFTFVWDDK